MSLLSSVGRRRNVRPDPVPYLDGRVLVWEDDFESGLSEWRADERVVNPNGELQAYTSRPENVRAVGSCLVLEARREAFMGQSWTSGRVDTNDRHEFHYGRLEARMKHPLAQGMWPAWWMLGATSANVLSESGISTWTGELWPACGEIDIMEGWGTEASMSSGIIFDAGGGTPGGVTAGAGGLDRSEWHTYALEWTPTTAAFSVDGVVHGTLATEGRPEFSRPMYVILNLAISGGVKSPDETTPDTARVLVDWVRVYAPVGATEVIVPASVALDNATLAVTVGGAKGITTATVSPADSQDKGVAWTTSDASVATVGGGYVTGKSAGTTTITATTWNGHSASCVVTVTA